jgi:putative Holliday junction resolvase
MSLYDSVDEYLAENPLPIKGRVLGFDVGTKTIGVSSADMTLTIASPLKLIERKGFQKDVAALKSVIEKSGAVMIIVGLPLSLDGTIGTQAEKTITFIEKIAQIFTMTHFVFWDERFSTQAVNRIFTEANVHHKKRDLLIDKAAASFILQGALDFLKGHA